MAVPGESGEHAGVRQCIEVAAIECRAARQIFYVAKRRLCARSDDSLDAGAGQATHHAQAETHSGRPFFLNLLNGRRGRRTPLFGKFSANG